MNPPPPNTTIPSPPPSPPKKKPTKGPPWTELETTLLIRAYEEKWYSLKRGLLRSHQWDSVASAVASRCGPLPTPPKTGVQCRHKMEKLRKRYREERGRPSPSRWPLFPLMDRLERGPLPISSCPPPEAGPPNPHPSSGSATAHDDSNDEEVIAGNHCCGKRARSRRDEEEAMAWRGEMAGELAAVMVRFEEGFLRIEKRRMEIVREFERDLMELEARRAEMAFDSRRCLLDVVDRAFRLAGNAVPKRPAPQE